MRLSRLYHGHSLIAGLLAFVLVQGSFIAFADVTDLPHPYSSNIAIVPGRCEGSAGCLPQCDTLPGYEGKICEEEILNRSTVKEINDIERLKEYNTIVFFQFCDIGNNDYADFRTVLLQWLKMGGKLIIIDSDTCNRPQGTQADYSWLSEVEADFETDAPGQLGAHGGKLVVVEENKLSSADENSLFYVDTNAIVYGTDAVGDMNVIITYREVWCADMEGENVNEVTGYAHAYTMPGSRSLGNGWIIYDALDTDYISTPPSLGSLGSGGQEIGKIYQFELMHGWGSKKETADLRCSVRIRKPCTEPAQDRFHELELMENQFLGTISEAYDDISQMQYLILAAKYQITTGKDITSIEKKIERVIDTGNQLLKDTGGCEFEEEEGGKLQAIGCLKEGINGKIVQLERALNKLMEEGVIGQLRGYRLLRRLDELTTILHKLNLEFNLIELHLELVDPLLRGALACVRVGDLSCAYNALTEATPYLGDALRTKSAVLNWVRGKMVTIVRIKQALFAAERVCRSTRSLGLSENDQVNIAPLNVTRIGLYPNPMRNTDAATFKVDGVGIEGIEAQIYDLSGREVFQQETVNGVTSLNFYGMDNAGHLLANGVYLYVITVRGDDGAMITGNVGKLVLLR